MSFQNLGTWLASVVEAGNQYVIKGNSETIQKEGDYFFYPYCQEIAPPFNIYVNKWFKTKNDASGHEVRRQIITTDTNPNFDVKIAVDGAIVFVAIGWPGKLEVYRSADGGNTYALVYSHSSSVNYDVLAMRSVKDRCYIITRHDIFWYNTISGWQTIPLPLQNTGNIALIPGSTDEGENDVVLYLACAFTGNPGNIYEVRGFNTAAPEFRLRYTTVNNCYSCEDGMQFRGNKIFAVWQDAAAPVAVSYYSKSDDLGLTWSTEEEVKPPTAASPWPCWNPRIDYDVDTQYLFVVVERPPQGGTDTQSTEFLYKNVNVINDPLSWSPSEVLTSNDVPAIYATILANTRSLIFENEEVQIQMHDNTNQLIWFTLKFRKGSQQGGITPPANPDRRDKDHGWPQNRQRPRPFSTSTIFKVQIYIDTDGDLVDDSWVTIPFVSMQRTRDMNAVSQLRITVKNIAVLMPTPPPGSAGGGTRINYERYSILDSVHFNTQIRVIASHESLCETSDELWFYGFMRNIQIRVAPQNNELSMDFFDPLVVLSKKKCFVGTGAPYPDNPSNPDFISRHLTETLDFVSQPYYLDCPQGAAPDDISTSQAFDLSFDPGETVIDALKRMCEYARYYFFWWYEYGFIYIRHWKVFDMELCFNAYVVGDSRLDAIRSELPDRFYNSCWSRIYPLYLSDVNITMDNIVNNIRAEDNNVPPNVDQQNDAPSEAQYGTHQMDATGRVTMNTGSTVNNLGTVTKIDQNKINRAKDPWLEAKFSTIGQIFLNPGDIIYINDRVGGADRIDDLATTFGFLWRARSITDAVTAGDWKTNITAETQIEIAP